MPVCNLIKNFNFRQWCREAEESCSKITHGHVNQANCYCHGIRQAHLRNILNLDW